MSCLILPQDRMWRKNTKDIEDKRESGCFGVNLVKNFDVHFGGKSVSLTTF